MRKYAFKPFLVILAFFVTFGLKAQTSKSPQETHKRLSVLNKALKDQSHNWFRHKNYNKQFNKETERLHAKTMRKALEEERRHLEMLRAEGADAHGMEYEKKMFKYQGQAEGGLNKFEEELAKEHPNPKKVKSHGLAVNRSAKKMERTHNLWIEDEKIKPPE